jgi:hypothetical protein
MRTPPTEQPPRLCSCGNPAQAYIWGSWLCEECLEIIMTPTDDEFGEWEPERRNQRCS